MLRMTKAARVLLLAAAMCGTAIHETEALEAQPQGECAKLTRKDLAATKAAVIQYLQDKKPESWETYVAELRLSPKGDPPPWPTIGLWRCEVRRDGLALLQMLRPAAFRGLFGVYLARKDSKWVVREECGGEELFRFD
jgi:hypothetical protein